MPPLAIATKSSRCLRLLANKPSSFLVCRRRRRRHPFSSGFSATWQSVDHRLDSNNEDPLQAPNPLEYLNGFDSVPAVRHYKQALLNACELQESHCVLDVGCGTVTHIPQYAKAVGRKGHVTAIDCSKEVIEHAQKTTQSKYNNITFQVADVYQLPFQSRYFDVAKEDRVLQHLNRPLEAVQEMLRVVKPEGTVVISNPDFRSFVMDHSAKEQRWGQSCRPPSDLDFDMAALTKQVLNGVVPTLCVHPSMGIQSPRLLRAAGCDQIELQVVPLVLVGRSDLEKVVPISYMARLSHANGGITREEMDLWLSRLEWEEHKSGGGNSIISGTLNMYIARGIKPGGQKQYAWKKPIGTKIFESSEHHPPKPKLDPTIRLATTKDPPELIEQARNMVNNEYGTSDTGVTLSSQRLRPQDIEEMVANNELMLAFDSHEQLVGCIQVKLKQQTKTSKNDKGLPSFGSGNNEIVGEFTCLAVPSNIHATVKHANTQSVEIVRAETTGRSRRGRGVGAALVAAAEDHARQNGAARMTLGILSPAKHEPASKLWLHDYYRRLGYEYRSTVQLEFEKEASGKVMVDQLHDMYEPLHQLVQCKAILFDKVL